jgi:hypothetical protein
MRMNAPPMSWYGRMGSESSTAAKKMEKMIERRERRETVGTGR